jgi:hypothetical protein
MFDSNAMHELAAISRDRYQRAGGGGAHNVHNTSKAYFDARGHSHLSTWDRAIIETRFRWEQSSQMAREHFRIACLTCKEGFYHGEDIPF